MRYTKTGFAVVALCLAGSAIGAFAWTAREPNAAMSMDQARAIALREAPGGVITEEELEREGARSVYSFDIRMTDGRVQEVEIDAATGAVLGDDEDDVEDDDEDPDDGEDRDEPGARPEDGERKTPR